MHNAILELDKVHLIECICGCNEFGAPLIVNLFQNIIANNINEIEERFSETLLYNNTVVFTLARHISANHQQTFQLVWTTR